MQPSNSNRALLAALTGFLAAAAVQAGVNGWSSIGPFGRGGAVRAIVASAEDPPVVYAGTEVGVFRSRDSGVTWQPASNGLTTVPIAALALDPRSPATVYAAGGGGVFKSDNRGENWRPINDGLNGQGIGALAIDPVVSLTLYAGSSTYPNGVFKSTDGGQTWLPFSAGLLNSAVSDLAVDPGTSSTIYAATSGGVFKSMDGASTWTALSTGLASVQSLAIDPATPSTVYAAGNRVSRSTDRGGNWTLIDQGLPGRAVTSLRLDPRLPETLYAGTVAVFATGGGVFRSTDSGFNWKRIDNGAAETGVLTLAIDPRNSSIVYAGGATSNFPDREPSGGFIVSRDGGAIWVQTEARFRGLSIQALAVAASAPSILYVAGGPPDLAALVYRSSDGGTTWKEGSAGLSESRILVLAVDPTTPNTVYAGTFNGVFKTLDGGQNWTKLAKGPSGFVRVLAIDPVSPSTIYAGGPGIFKTADAGASWTVITGDVTDQVFALAVDPSSPIVVYAGGVTGFYKSESGGAQWSLLRRETYEGVGTLAIDPATPSRVHAATLYVGPRPPELPPYDSVLSTTDGGATWHAPTSGTPHGVTSLAIDPVAPATLYASSNFLGVYRTADAGVTWSSFNDGLTEPYVYQVAIGAGSPSTVYVGTLRQSIFSASAQTGVSPPTPTPPGTFGVTPTPGIPTTQVPLLSPPMLALLGLALAAAGFYAVAKKP